MQINNLGFTKVLPHPFPKYLEIIATPYIEKTAKHAHRKPNKNNGAYPHFHL